MENSLFFTKFWGWYLIIFFFILSFNPKRIKQIFNNLKDEKLKGIIGSSVCGAATLTVWIWNVYDLNKSMSSIFDMPMEISMTRQGNIKVSASF